MEAERTDKDYLKERKLSDLFFEPPHCQTMIRRRGRLVAGGFHKSSTESRESLSIQDWMKRDKNGSADPKPPANGNQPADEKKPKKKYPQPVVVMRSNRQRYWSQGYSGSMRFGYGMGEDMARKKNKLKKCSGRLVLPNAQTKGCPSNHSISSNKSEASDNLETHRLYSCNENRPKNADCAEPEPSENSTECKAMPMITSELGSIKKALERKIQVEVKQKKQLNVINEQLKNLCRQIQELDENCKSGWGKCMKKKLSAEPKLSSLCQFCKDKNLPVVDNLAIELFKIIGKRSYQDLILNILLRADNVFHVNVTDLSTGRVLGCLLVNEDGIRDAHKRGLFRDILTFYVIDVRSTAKTRDKNCGCISFEYVREQRLGGGGEALFGREQLSMREKNRKSNSHSGPQRCTTPVNSQEEKVTDQAILKSDDHQSDAISDLAMTPGERKKKSDEEFSKLLRSIKTNLVAKQTAHSFQDELNSGD